jgi:hypothetical protein
MKFMDFLLLPESLFKKLSDKKITLYAGFVFVGIVDLILSRLMVDFQKNFTGKTPEVLTHNIIFLVLFVIIIGVLDVAFFSIPLHDLFRFFKKKITAENISEKLSDKFSDKLIDELEPKKKDKSLEDKPEHDPALKVTKTSEPNLRIKLMKVYIAAHFLVVPVDMVINYMTKNIDEKSSAVILFMILFLVTMTMIWFNAIITRGASVIFQLGHGLKLLLYMAIFAWNFMFAKALTFAIDAWIIPFFK